MPGFSTYQANQTLQDTLVDPYATRFVALFVADPTDDNVTTNEVTGAWYGRRPTGSWASPTNGVTNNNNAIQWNPVAGGAVSVTHWGIYDAATSGNLLYSFQFSAPRVFNVDDIPLVVSGDLQITLL
jgi:hypothetical protein